MSFPLRAPFASTAVVLLALSAEAKVPGPEPPRRLSAAGFSGGPASCHNFAGVYFNLETHTQVAIIQKAGSCSVKMRQKGKMDERGFAYEKDIQVSSTYGTLIEGPGKHSAIRWPSGEALRGMSYKDCPPQGWSFHVADAGAAWWDDSSTLHRFTMTSDKCQLAVDGPGGRKTWEVRPQATRPHELRVFDENKDHRGVLVLDGASVSYSYALDVKPPPQMTPCADPSTFHDEVAYEKCNLRWRPDAGFCASVGCRYDFQTGKCGCPDEARCRNLGGVWTVRRCSDDLAEYQAGFGWDPVSARDEEASLRHVQSTCHRWQLASHVQMLADKCCRGAASICGSTEKQCLSASAQKVKGLEAKGYHLSPCRTDGATR